MSCVASIQRLTSIIQSLSNRCEGEFSELSLDRSVSAGATALILRPAGDFRLAPWAILVVIASTCFPLLELESLSSKSELNSLRTAVDSLDGDSKSLSTSSLLLAL